MLINNLIMENKYSLIGNSEHKDVKNVRWFRPEVDINDIRILMEKSDKLALRDTLIWLGVMAITVYIAILLSPSLISVPFWMTYGVLYGSAADARWHECGHKTAFKTLWMNEIVYQIACFMMMRNPVAWRSSHVRHHTDTIIVGRDPEIVAMRPPDLRRIILNLFGIIDVFEAFKRILLHASGRINAEETTYVRTKDYAKVFLIARIWLLIYLCIILLCLNLSSILPLMVVGLPRLYGAWHHVLTGVLQHLGLAENVSDHRLNTRTVLMNPISRFIYLNMNYHLEHHMFTMVPYYNLPKLHELIKHDVPKPELSIFSAYKRLLPVLIKQLKYENAVIIPELPKGATPYQKEVNKLLENAV